MILGVLDWEARALALLFAPAGPLCVGLTTWRSFAMFLALNKTSPADLAASRPDAATIEGSLDDMVLREACEAKDIACCNGQVFLGRERTFLSGLLFRDLLDC